MHENTRRLFGKDGFLSTSAGEDGLICMTTLSTVIAERFDHQLAKISYHNGLTQYYI
jgi:hypothetical protein